MARATTRGALAGVRSLPRPPASRQAGAPRGSLRDRAGVLPTGAALAALGALGCAGGRAGLGAPGGDFVASLRVPQVRQDGRSDCGFAALEMLAAYHGREVPAAERERVRLEAESPEGVRAGSLAAALEAGGYTVRIFPGDLADAGTPRGVAYHLAKGRPLVVMLAARGANHYAVVSGLDLARGVVTFEDPRRGRTRLALSRFTALWERAGRFTMLAVPGGRPG